jgi:DNA-binding NarL/FixJ family response regulator
MNGPAAARNSASRTEALERGRESLRRQEWSSAFSSLSAADREAPIEPADLEGLAMAAHLLGKEAEGGEILARAHQLFLSAGDAPRAARCAFWLGFGLLTNGDMAQAGGWLARARRLLDDGGHDCVEQGYLLVPAGIRAVRDGDPDTAYTAFVQAVAIGERFGDRDLVAVARNGQGRALIRRGEIARGVSLLDEAMVAVTAGEVSHMVIGGIYCSVIDACGEIFDLRRAREWTTALDRWCASLPDRVPYRGHCLVRRAEILQLHGAWPDALDEVKRAREWLSIPTPRPALGGALYRMAELHRVLGEFALSEEAYRQASLLERRPQPGFALLRLAQGQTDAALTAIRQVADEIQDVTKRPQVLEACVEIMLAANDVKGARAAAAELAEIASKIDAPLLDAVSARATGAVLLAEQDARQALAVLRQALTAWRDLEAPYEMARVRVLIALACRALGNRTTADVELEAACAVFRQLGAAPDAARVETLLRTPEEKVEGPLTARELQVLTLIASGRTNRAIAGELCISEKTVARHVSNIFTKLDLTSRAAATAYAYRHGLAGSPST